MSITFRYLNSRSEPLFTTEKRFFLELWATNMNSPSPSLQRDNDKQAQTKKNLRINQKTKSSKQNPFLEN